MRTRCCVHSHASFPTHLGHAHVRVVLGLQRLDSCIMGRLVWVDMCEMQCLSNGVWGVVPEFGAAPPELGTAWTRCLQPLEPWPGDGDWY